MEGVEAYLKALVTSVLDGVEWSASRPVCFALRRKLLVSIE